LEGLEQGGWPRTLGLEGIEAIVLRTVSDQPTLWDAILPSELLVLPDELGRVDVLLDDPVFFAPFAAHFDARIGRPSIPMETYLRLMFLKFRYRLGYEVLCREVADSISWQRFCRIPLGMRVPHPTTLMKITTRCGDYDSTVASRAVLHAVETPNCRTPSLLLCFRGIRPNSGSSHVFPDCAHRFPDRTAWKGFAG
jgi:hypothetical protein